MVCDSIAGRHGSHQRHGFTGFDTQVQIVQHRLVTIGGTHPSELEHAPDFARRAPALPLLLLVALAAAAAAPSPAADAGPGLQSSPTPA